MQKYLFLFLLFAVFSSSAFAINMHEKSRYFASRFMIKNDAPYPISLMLYESIGIWKKPVTLKKPMILLPHQVYRNVLHTVPGEGGLENYFSFVASKVGDERENYLIFGGGIEGGDQSIVADIVDGLGNLFVDSWTNLCEGVAANGESYCRLVIRA